MKSFKKYINEEPVNPERENFYVVVKSGKAVLCTTNRAAPCTSFGSGVVYAVIQGENIITTLNDGKTQIWRLDASSLTVTGPIQSR
jgi:hypothetical protein